MPPHTNSESNPFPQTLTFGFLGCICLKDTLMKGAVFSNFAEQCLYPEEIYVRLSLIRSFSLGHLQKNHYGFELLSLGN